jgi:hypothetical protein
VAERLGFRRKLRQNSPDLGTYKGAQVEPPSDDPDRTARALSLFNEARDPVGSPVDKYLARRGLGEVGKYADLRFHPRCPFAGKRTPAMVALVRDILSNEPKAVHRTALTVDGHKVKLGDTDRLALGPIAGGAVKLTPDEDVTTCLGIGEGIETTLSLRNLPEFGPSPVWSLLNAGGLESFPVLPGIECLWIAVDHDPAGLKAARACAYRWQSAGREAFLVTPSAPRADLNDLFTGARHG